MSLVKTLIEKGHQVHTIAPVDEYTPLLISAGCTHHNLKMEAAGQIQLKIWL
jgi:hypothetical protein